MTVYEAMQSCIVDTTKFVEMVQMMRIEQREKSQHPIPNSQLEILVDAAVDRWIDDILPRLLKALEKEKSKLNEAKESHSRSASHHRRV